MKFIEKESVNIKTQKHYIPKMHHFDIRSSKTLICLLALLNVFGIYSVLGCKIHVFLKIISICLLTFYFCELIFLEFFQLSSNSIVRIYINSGLSTLVSKNGSINKAELLTNNFASSLLLILNFKIENFGKKISIIICKDAISIDQFRVLKSHIINRVK